MQKLTIGEVIAYVDAIKPNTRTPEEKKLWLNDCDTMIKEDIFNHYEGAYEINFNGYTEDTDESQELLVPAHYGRGLYAYYIMMQIDYINAETNKYSMNATMYQSAFDGFAIHWHNTHMPLQPNSINVIREGNNYVNPLSNF